MENINDSIRCPYCDWEYLAGEIYLPVSLVGQPEKIIKDPIGNVIYKEYKKGKEVDLEESFDCLNCGRAFKVYATVSFKSKAEKEDRDFSNLETSLF